MAAAIYSWSVFIAVLTASHYSSALMLKHKHVPHTVPPGYRIASLSGWGQDFQIDPSIGQDLSKFFSVLRNGDIITNSDVSSLVGQTIAIPVIGSLASKSWTQVVRFKIVDADHTLHFLKELYGGYVSENLPPGSIVEGISDLHATIGDPSKRISYKLTGGATDLFVAVDLSGNQVQIDTRDVLDREQQDEYILTLRAHTNDPTDAPAFTKVKVIVNDTDDNIPEFDQPEYEFVIPDTTPVSTTVLRPRVNDPDSGELSFSLEDPLDLFSIDKKTGAVILSSYLPLQAQSYKMAAYVEDSAKHRAGPVVIRVVVEGPVVYSHPHRVRHKRDTLPVRIVEVPESHIAGVILDLDNTYYERFHFKPPAPEKLELNAVTGIVRLKPDEMFDYEEASELSFTVVITKTDDPNCEYSTSAQLVMQFFTH